MDHTAPLIALWGRKESIMIRTLNTTDMAHMRAQLTSKGFTVSPEGTRIIIIGSNGNDIIPALEMVGLDGDQPIIHQVAQRSLGEWVPFDGVCFAAKTGN